MPGGHPRNGRRRALTDISVQPPNFPGEETEANRGCVWPGPRILKEELLVVIVSDPQSLRIKIIEIQ